MIEGDLEGMVTGVTESTVKGWAWDPSRPHARLEIEVLTAGTLVATVRADRPRQDLLQAGKSDGAHGFKFVIPAALKTDRPITLRLREASTGRLLEGGEVTIGPFPPPGTAAAPSASPQWTPDPRPAYADLDHPEPKAIWGLNERMNFSLRSDPAGWLLRALQVSLRSERLDTAFDLARYLDCTLETWPEQAQADFLPAMLAAYASRGDGEAIEALLARKSEQIRRLPKRGGKPARCDPARRDPPAASEPKGMIVANMATYPARAGCLEQAVASLLPQVDRLNLCLNGYEAPPAFLTGLDKVNAVIPDADYKDIGKFIFPVGEHDRVLLVDDDILYPGDYAERMVSKLMELDGLPAAVGVHGVIYSDFFDGRTASRLVHAFFGPLSSMKVVNQIGTGTTALLGRHLPPLELMADAAGFADVRFARLARENGLALVCVDRDGGWLKPIQHEGETLFRTVTSQPGPEVLAEIEQFGGFARLPLEAVAQVELGVTAV